MVEGVSTNSGSNALSLSAMTSSVPLLIRDLSIIPQLAAQRISSDDVITTIRVLKAVATFHPKHSVDGLKLYRDSSLRPLRKVLAECLEIHKLTMFGGVNEEAFFEKRQSERSLKRQKVAERVMQKQYIAKTQLRQGRMDRLAALQDQTDDKHAQLLVADGHVKTQISNRIACNLEDASSHSTVLPKLRSCYCCKIRFRELHHFYDQLCPACASLNFAKRHALASCQGKVAVLTGSRVKIGFQTALKLLRSGATVVGTSRFPNSAVEAFRKEADFTSFQDRLHLYGLDLRDVTGIEAFARFLKCFFPNGIDILIHNACQTIRRPAAYYAPLVDQERDLWYNRDEIHREILGGCIHFERLRRMIDQPTHRTSTPESSISFATPLLQLRNNGENQKGVERIHSDTDNGDLSSSCTSLKGDNFGATTTLSVTRPPSSSIESLFDRTGISHSAAMSQMILIPEDVGVSENVLPAGVSDINGQQLDLRSINSWILKMDQVSTPEVMECMFVNAIAPFVLNSRLQPLLTAGGDFTSRPNRFIVNVSAMEGKFNRYKTPNHPHTNMAKAALNMLTRTAAEDLAKQHRIYMNSVDTGWINDENPLERARKTAETNHFQTPIDEVDAAARILDPIFAPLNGELDTPVYGKFLKDYRESEW